MTTPHVPAGDVVDVGFADQLGDAFRDYMMSTVTSRALPDVRDGLKPVHRRILWAMHRSGFRPDGPYRKSARAVGDTMGRYHPHGDAAIYEALVRQAQPWSVRYPLVDGQGNFGSVDGDAPAAMRYTEARLALLADAVLTDADEDVVPFGPTYDESGREPKVLPVRFPLLLVNGVQGIATGIATSVPPHNLREAVDAALVVLEDPDASLDDVMTVMPGPDFPTGGRAAVSGLRQAYATGSGTIHLEGDHAFEDAGKGRARLVVTALPYGVAKEAFVRSLAALGETEKDKPPRVEGIVEVRDESDRHDPVRVVAELSDGADRDHLVAEMRRRTPFRQSVTVNLTVLAPDGAPRRMPLVGILRCFVDHRRTVVRARTISELDADRDDLARMVALYAAVGDTDRVVAVVRGSQDARTAREALKAIPFAVDAPLARMVRASDPETDVREGGTFRLDDRGADAVLGLNLRSLTSVERDALSRKAAGTEDRIRRAVSILSDAAVLDGVVREEVSAVAERFADDRRTTLVEAFPTRRAATRERAGRPEEREVAPVVPVVVAATSDGRLRRRTAANAADPDRRDVLAAPSPDETVVVALACPSDAELLALTSTGRMARVDVARIPDGDDGGAWTPAHEVGDVAPDETVTDWVVLSAIPDPDEGLAFVFAEGSIRLNPADDFRGMRVGGKTALPEGERPVAVFACGSDRDVVMYSAAGRACRFAVTELRRMRSRDSTGVRGMALKGDDKVVSAFAVASTPLHTLERETFVRGGTWETEGTVLLDGSGAERDVPDTVAVERLEGGRVRFALSTARAAELEAATVPILTVTANGWAKRIPDLALRTAGRGVQGVVGTKIDARTGPLVGAVPHAGGTVEVVTDYGRGRVDAHAVVRTTRDRLGDPLGSLPEGAVVERVVVSARTSVARV